MSVDAGKDRERAMTLTPEEIAARVAEIREYYTGRSPAAEAVKFLLDALAAETQHANEVQEYFSDNFSAECVENSCQSKSLQAELLAVKAERDQLAAEVSRLEMDLYKRRMFQTAQLAEQAERLGKLREAILHCEGLSIHGVVAITALIDSLSAPVEPKPEAPVDVICSRCGGYDGAHVRRNCVEHSQGAQSSDPIAPVVDGGSQESVKSSTEQVLREMWEAVDRLTGYESAGESWISRGRVLDLIDAALVSTEEKT